jgi:hypothetical protein
MKYLIIIAIALAIIVLIPCATIWSLNALFPALAIPLTFDTWCAALILSGVISGSTGFSFRKKD